MGLQDYGTALQNGRKSFNAACRQACSNLTARFRVTAVAASPAPTTTQIGLSDPTGFALGDLLELTISGVPAYAKITGLSGAVATISSLSGTPLSAAPAASSAVRLVISWYPPGAKATLKPADIFCPHIAGTFLRVGSFDALRQRLRTPLQLSVFTNHGREADAYRLAGGLLEELGIHLDNWLQFAELPQTDSESGLALPLLPMDLQLLQGFEPKDAGDPSVTHVFSEFNLYHE